jgi:hypothetical protein
VQLVGRELEVADGAAQLAGDELGHGREGSGAREYRPKARRAATTADRRRAAPLRAQAGGRNLLTWTLFIRIVARRPRRGRRPAAAVRPDPRKIPDVPGSRGRGATSAGRPARGAGQGERSMTRMDASRTSGRRTLGATVQLLTLAGALALGGCAAHLIPNTNIRDTEDNRAILEVLKRYKEAFEARDAKGVVALASTRYLDARDSISYTTLQEQLEGTFSKVKQTQLEMNVRRIDVNEQGRAEVEYFYSAAFQYAFGDGQWRTESDDKRMVLAREGNEWKVMSGL